MLIWRKCRLKSSCLLSASAERGAAVMLSDSIADSGGYCQAAGEPGEVRVIVGSFTFGMQQNMLAANREVHLENFARVCHKLVEQGDLDLLFGREVWGFP